MLQSGFPITFSEPQFTFRIFLIRGSIAGFQSYGPVSIAGFIRRRFRKSLRFFQKLFPKNEMKTKNFGIKGLENHFEISSKSCF